MKNEILKNSELISPNQPIEIRPQGDLTPEVAHELFEQRLAETEALHPFVSLKFFYQVKEKIVREQSMARKLLKIEEEKQEKLDQYSFILNPTYFEQKLIS